MFFFFFFADFRRANWRPVSRGIHTIGRSFEKPRKVMIGVSTFGGLENSAVHHILEGLLNNARRPNEPRQIGRTGEKLLYFDGRTPKVTLPHRSISCMEFTRK
ncbi:MAG: hypothetical protein ACYTBS_24940 [Planctomycetota bacterium]